MLGWSSKMTMNVIVPYVNPMDAQATALAMERIYPTYIKMEDDEHYWRLLKELWTSGEPFIILEQDMIPWPGALKQLWDCEEEWCAFPYKLSHDNGFTCALGCTKFGSQLTQRLPNALDLLAEGHTTLFWARDGITKHWLGLDSRLAMTIYKKADRNGWPHRHEPPVIHLNLMHTIAGGRHSAEISLSLLRIKGK